MFAQLRTCLVATAVMVIAAGALWAQEVMEYQPWPRIDWTMPGQTMPEDLPEGEPLGAEDASAEDDIPRIPEPLVFDLVRPLGAKRGEFEINTLGIVPIGRAPNSSVPDALGLSGSKFEWAPEVEWAVRDGLAIEFELPFETTEIAAYKSAVQWTFGTAFDRHFVHGAQAIVQYDVHGESWLPTLLYVAGVRFDEVWSCLGMIGVRGDTGAEVSSDRVQRLLNLSLFADVMEHVTAGVETNLSTAMRGNSALMVMPQVHWEIADYFMIQAGTGGRFASDGSMGEAAFRVIRSF